MATRSKVPHDTRWSVFAVGLVAVALVGLFATVVGVGGPGRPEGAAAVAAGAPGTDTTSTTGATTTTSRSATVDATTTTAAPTTSTTGAPRPTPASTSPAPPPTATPAPTTPPTAPPATAAPRPGPTAPAPPSPAELQRIARNAAVVAHTTGHRVDGLPSVEVLFAPELRPALDGIVRDAAYRAAGCRQWVTETIAGPGTATSFGFSLTLERTCARVPTIGGRPLPLTTGAYAIVTVGSTPSGTWWTVGLTSE